MTATGFAHPLFSRSGCWGKKLGTQVKCGIPNIIMTMEKVKVASWSCRFTKEMRIDDAKWTCQNRATAFWLRTITLHYKSPAPAVFHQNKLKTPTDIFPRYLSLFTVFQMMIAPGCYSAASCITWHDDGTENADDYQSHDVKMMVIESWWIAYVWDDRGLPVAWET